ncbi:hypothetical protein ACIBKY_41860 [Nonomuraea sp. NPDC050394]|uniref:hypothetical protein n=1 Tax=Nonomuraea sp. NPDC050394 TaxID=3364363 RepID=UPI0037B89344
MTDHETDPRDRPAPFGVIVGLTTLSAIAVMVVTHLLATPVSMKWLLVGPIALVVYEVVIHELWWRRWWGAIPGALAGLVIYFEGREMVTGFVGPSWAGAVAYVAAWSAFAAIFALASRVSVFAGDRPLRDSGDDEEPRPA